MTDPWAARGVSRMMPGTVGGRSKIARPVAEPLPVVRPSRGVSADIFGSGNDSDLTYWNDDGSGFTHIDDLASHLGVSYTIFADRPGGFDGTRHWLIGRDDDDDLLIVGMTRGLTSAISVNVGREADPNPPDVVDMGVSANGSWRALLTLYNGTPFDAPAATVIVFDSSGTPVDTHLGPYGDTGEPKMHPESSELFFPYTPDDSTLPDRLLICDLDTGSFSGLGWTIDDVIPAWINDQDEPELFGCLPLPSAQDNDLILAGPFKGLARVTRAGAVVWDLTDTGTDHFRQYLRAPTMSPDGTAMWVMFYDPVITPTPAANYVRRKFDFDGNMLHSTSQGELPTTALWTVF